MSFARSKWGGFHVMRDPPAPNRLLKNLVAYESFFSRLLD